MHHFFSKNSEQNSEDEEKLESEKVKEYEKRISDKEKSKTQKYVAGQTDERKYRTHVSKYKDNNYRKFERKI